MCHRYTIAPVPRDEDYGRFIASALSVFQFLNFRANPVVLPRRASMKLLAQLLSVPEANGMPIVKGRCFRTATFGGAAFCRELPCWVLGSFAMTGFITVFLFTLR